jgi:hypothetical protein
VAITASTIRLSKNGTNGLPKRLIINTPTSYGSPRWFIDSVTSADSVTNLVTVDAATYTFGNEHTITFTGTKGGVQFSRTIWFVVEY